MNAPYRYNLLDPRPCAQAEMRNAALLGSATLGIEVTIPALAARCGLGNIDPQHTGGDRTCAAVEACLEAPPPNDGAKLVTVRPDPDSVGGMAVLTLRALNRAIGPGGRRRIDLVAAADRFVRGQWPGRRPLPTPANPFDPNSDESEHALAAIACAVADHALPLTRRVELVMHWLLTGEEPGLYRQVWLRQRQATAEMLAAGLIRIEPAAEGRMAVVVADRPGTVAIGYRIAPVVVALNERFRLGEGPPHRKYTVAQYETGYVNMAALRQALSAREPGWGGTATIIGSPQGVASALPLDQVVDLVARHLLERG